MFAQSLLKKKQKQPTPKSFVKSWLQDFGSGLDGKNLSLESGRVF